MATISANNDPEIGEIVAEALHRCGKEGAITVEQGKSMKHELEVVEGMKINRGFISPYFATDNLRQTCELENPLILISEKRIFKTERILKFMNYALENARSLLIIAEEVNPEPLTNLIVNKMKVGLKVCAIKAPSFGDQRKFILQDISFLTGSTLISEDSGIQLMEEEGTLAAGIEVLGTAGKVVITKDDTLILNAKGDKHQIEERVEMLR